MRPKNTEAQKGTERKEGLKNDTFKRKLKP